MATLLLHSFLEDHSFILTPILRPIMEHSLVLPSATSRCRASTTPCKRSKLSESELSIAIYCWLNVELSVRGVGIGSRYERRGIPKEAMPELWVLWKQAMEGGSMVSSNSIGKKYTNIDHGYAGRIYSG